MLLVFVILVFLSLAGFAGWKAYKHKPEPGSGKIKKGFWVLGSAASSMLAGILFVGLSVLYVGEHEFATLSGVYLPNDMKSGQIVALAGQNGPQARIVTPGFKFESFVRFLYDVGFEPVLEIPQGYYGIVYAKDGEAMRPGQVIADPWDNYKDMINAEKFLTEGGQRGPQLTVLPPARYQINPNVFTVKLAKALQVNTGEVAVIRSNVQTSENCPEHEATTGLNTSLVPKGCRGVWETPLYPDMYYLNEDAYIATKISTRAQVWAYKGGYTTEKIVLSLDSKGEITQTTTIIDVPQPANAADAAITVRVEGWTVPIETRVTVQVAPEDAPRVVAGVGSLQEVENKITTPNIRDTLRTIGGQEESGCTVVEKVKTCTTQAARVRDFVTKRNYISKKVFKDIVSSTEAAGVTVLEVNLGEPAIPPALLIPDQRKQLAQQLAETYEAEKNAQQLRIAVEKEKATADQQGVLVAAQIAEEASVKLMEKRSNQGKGEQMYLTAVAKGEKARKNVLGEANVVYLKALEIVAANPDIIKVPNTSVTTGGGSSMEGMAAVFGGNSNLGKLLQGPVQK